MGNSENALSGTRETLDGVDWDKLDKIAGPKKPPANSFTVYDLATRYEVSRWTAQKRLNLLVAEGKIKKYEGGGGKPHRYELVE